MWRYRALLAICLFVCGWSNGGLAQTITKPRYKILDLGVAAEGCLIRVNALGPQGYVVGSETNLDNSTRIFLWSAGQKLYIKDAINFHISPCYVDKKGMVSGYAEPLKSNELNHGNVRLTPFTWQSGKFHLLIRGLDKFPNAVVNGANETGYMVGHILTASHKLHAFSYDGQKFIDIGEKIGEDSDSSAAAINDNNHVVGIVKVSGETGYSGFIWNGHSFTKISQQQKENVIPNAINKYDQVVGIIGGPGMDTQAFIWDRDVVTPLFPDNNLYPSYAYAINDFGVVVGTRGQHAFSWQGGHFLDLNDVLGSGNKWELEDAVRINNNGQIIGTARYKGEIHAYRLDPIK